jgi:acyl carrier protein
VDAILASKDLFKDGWLDSLLNLQLLAFVEKNAGVKIPTAQVTRKSFQTVASICSLAKSAKK